MSSDSTLKKVYRIKYQHFDWPAKIVLPGSSEYRNGSPLNHNDNPITSKRIQVFGKDIQFWIDPTKQEIYTIGDLREALKKFSGSDKKSLERKGSLKLALKFLSGASGNPPSDDEEEAFEEDEGATYEVEKVLDSEQRADGVYYFIKWRHFPDSDNTWEPEANLTEDLLAPFKSMQKKKQMKVKNDTKSTKASTAAKKKEPRDDDEDDDYSAEPEILPSKSNAVPSKKRKNVDTEPDEVASDSDKTPPKRQKKAAAASEDDHDSEAELLEDIDDKNTKSRPKRKRLHHTDSDAAGDGDDDSDLPDAIHSDEDEDSDRMDDGSRRNSRPSRPTRAAAPPGRNQRQLPARRAAASQAQLRFTARGPKILDEDGVELVSSESDRDANDDGALVISSDDEKRPRRSSIKKGRGGKLANGKDEFVPDEDEDDDDLPQTRDLESDSDDYEKNKTRRGAGRRGGRGGRRAPARLPTEPTRQSARSKRQVRYVDVGSDEDIPMPEPSESSSSEPEESEDEMSIDQDTGLKKNAQEVFACITCKNFVPKSQRSICPKCHKAQHVKCFKPKSKSPTKTTICQYCSSYQCDVCSRFEHDSAGRASLVQCTKCLARYHPHCYPPAAQVKDLKNWVCPDCVEEKDRHVDVIQFRRPCSEHAHETFEYYVKWSGISNLHNCWLKERRARRVCPAKLKNFLARLDTKDDDELARDEQRYSEWEKVDRIITKGRHPETDGKAYLVKWQDLDYDQATWEEAALMKEKFPEKVEQYHTRRHHIQARFELFQNNVDADADQRMVQGTLQFKPFKVQPSYLPHPLYAYQLTGLNWMRYNWYNHINCILGDEMGLGKTVQAISFILSLREEHEVQTRPFMVVAPLSTIPNWQREFQRWAPTLNVVAYNGAKESRALIQQYEFFKKDGANQALDDMNEDEEDDSEDDSDGDFGSRKSRKKKPAKTSRIQPFVKFDVLLMSYEMVPKETSQLRRLDWEALIVDEGHRLKTDTNRLYTNLNAFTFRFRMLLTGTPLQNNLKELFNLLQFIDPSKYNTLDLEAEFEAIRTPVGKNGTGAMPTTPKEGEDALKPAATGKSEAEGNAGPNESKDRIEVDDEQADTVAKLHELLKPRILRRLKVETLGDLLPNKVSLVVPVAPSKLERQVYTELLTKNYATLQGAGKKAQMNLLMQLQKCCNHPYLFEGMEPTDQKLDDAEVHRLLVEASGKLTLLDKMLPKLKAGGHRVLLFAHMTTVLDIMEDYLRYNKWGYCRLDGNTSHVDRQLLIDRFNNKPEENFIFLLSTLAGGLGINLATADTVILYDSDWNPHNDLQALSRCHRIGQKNKVMIYRLVMANSVEEGILRTAQKKLALEHVVVRQMERGVDTQTLKAILGHGAAKLFSEDDSNTRKYDDAAIDKLLDRSQEEVQPTDASAPGASAALKQYLGAFTVARAWGADDGAHDSDEIQLDDGAVDWDSLLAVRHSQWQRQKDEELGRGKRRAATRNVVYYQDKSGKPESSAFTTAVDAKKQQTPYEISSSDESVSDSGEDDVDADGDEYKETSQQSDDSSVGEAGRSPNPNEVQELKNPDLAPPKKKKQKISHHVPASFTSGASVPAAAAYAAAAAAAKRKPAPADVPLTTETAGKIQAYYAQQHAVKAQIQAVNAVPRYSAPAVGQQHLPASPKFAGMATLPGTLSPSLAQLQHQAEMGKVLRQQLVAKKLQEQAAREKWLQAQKAHSRAVAQRTPDEIKFIDKVETALDLEYRPAILSSRPTPKIFPAKSTGSAVRGQAAQQAQQAHLHQPQQPQPPLPGVAAIIGPQFVAQAAALQIGQQLLNRQGEMTPQQVALLQMQVAKFQQAKATQGKVLEAISIDSDDEHSVEQKTAAQPASVSNAAFATKAAPSSSPTTAINAMRTFKPPAKLLQSATSPRSSTTGVQLASAVKAANAAKSAAPHPAAANPK